MLVLSGVGETRFKIVSPVVWSWIFSPRPMNEQGTDYAKRELVPQEVLDEVERCGEGRFHEGYNYGTDDNDRALHAPGFTFFSMTETMDYLRDNNIDIITEYRGCSY